MATQSAEWYLTAKDGDRQGPFDESEVRRLIQRGEITPVSHVWRDGLDDWIQLKDCDELQTPIPPAPPKLECKIPPPPPMPARSRMGNASAATSDPTELFLQRHGVGVTVFLNAVLGLLIAYVLEMKGPIGIGAVVGLISGVSLKMKVKKHSIGSGSESRLWKTGIAVSLLVSGLVIGGVASVGLELSRQRHIARRNKFADEHVDGVKEDFLRDVSFLPSWDNLENYNARHQRLHVVFHMPPTVNLPLGEPEGEGIEAGASLWIEFREYFLALSERERGRFAYHALSRDRKRYRTAKVFYEKGVFRDDEFRSHPMTLEGMVSACGLLADALLQEYRTEVLGRRAFSPFFDDFSVDYDYSAPESKVWLDEYIENNLPHWTTQKSSLFPDG